MRIIQEHAFIYSLWNGKLNVYEGTIYGGYALGYGSFQSREKSFAVTALRPGEVYNALVWFEEKDDKAAKKIFIKHEELAIFLLQRKIDNHQNRITFLKD